MSWDFDQNVKDMNSLLEETSKEWISEEDDSGKYEKWNNKTDEEKKKIKEKLSSMSGQFASNLKAFLEKEGKLSDEQIDAVMELGESISVSSECLNEEFSEVNNALALIEGVEAPEVNPEDSVTEIYLNEEKGFGFAEVKTEAPKTVLTEKSRMQGLMDLKDRYEGKWIDAKVLEARPSRHGKGYDITVMITDKKAGDLPSIIETEMVSKEVKKGDKIKVQLYISAGGILVDKIK